MTRSIHLNLKAKLASITYFCISLLLPMAASAATITLANAPLTNSSTSSVLPNLMYVLDNSGSMDRDYMPDYINSNFKCKDNDSAGNFDEDCDYGDPAWMSNDFNSVYYNPEVLYVAGMNANGIPKPSMTSANTAGWTAVLRDPYLSTSTQNLVPNGSNTTGYPDRVWCNTNSVSTANLSNTTICKKNNQYTYPTSTFDKAKTLLTNPFYYKINPTEYCANRDLTSCQPTADATHIYPARLRWCNSAALTNCQAKYTDSTYYFAKWLGITSTSAGTIRIDSTNTNVPTASPTPLSVTGITVNGVSLIPASPVPALQITDNTVASQRNSLAANIASVINGFVSAPNYTATSSGDVVTVNAGTPITASIIVTATTAVGTGAPTTKAQGGFKVNNVRKNKNISSIKVGGVEILGATQYSLGNGTSGSQRRADLATKIVNRINAYVSSPDYIATKNSAGKPTITITAVTGGSASNGNLSFIKTNGIGFTNIVHLAGGGGAGVGQNYTVPVVVTDFTNGAPTVASFQRVDIEPGTTSYPKGLVRTDCLGATCTFAEEMTNFANWYAYYRTRMLLMKTSTSLAFKDINTDFRVGFITISNQSSTNHYLPITKFDQTQKNSWYAKLFATSGGGGTPLRSALTTVGRIYAGKSPVSGYATDDPVQYSCQQNFTLLTTDGYWNTDSTSSVKDIAGTGNVGNVDASPAPRPFYEGPSGYTASLADAAKYYYETDLRNATYGNCTGAPINAAGDTEDVCLDNVFVSSTDNNAKQHMTTYTLGLGVDGLVNYANDYKTQTSGDFFDIKNGTADWPVPVSSKQTSVDDLWHAAVNGRGTYFSAKDPTQLSTSLRDALTSITSKKGAGAAAATSTLNPVAGDNFAYVASYQTVKWTGNLEARAIDLTTGEVGVKADWCLEDVDADSCTGTNSSIVNELVGGVTKTFCKTTSSSALTCVYPGVLDGSNNCRVELATYCPGTMSSRVAATSDTRDIFINDGGVLVPFNFTNLGAIGEATNFQTAFLSANLSQWSSLTVAQQAAVPGANIVNFLRGQTGFEDRSSNVSGAVDNRLFRLREGVIGDALDSTPTFNGVPKASYTDIGYGPATTSGTFASAQANRDGTIYVGTNDGMLHAIDADNGDERWTFVPTQVIKNMWKLADANYAANHINFVNGEITINDICTANCSSGTATWKTVLVGGLGSGGKGYFALDITDPDSPDVLWEFDDTVDDDVGYSFGNPIITKKADGTWVVLVTSGYNNISGSNPGKGFLYVLDAVTGQIIVDSGTLIPFKYATGEGDATTPSGLAKIRGFIAEAQKNNTVLNVYGGDLKGNVWRFDINNPQSPGNSTTRVNPFKLAKLKDASGNEQPITVKPELSAVGNKRLVFFGTGKYLEISDLSDTSTQSLYAFTDESYDDLDNLAATLNNPRTDTNMVNQVITNSGAQRSVSSNAVDYTTDRGWYIDLPDTGERQNVPSQLVFGTLLVPTIVPSNTACSPGGYGWINFLNFKTGSIVAGSIIGSKTNAPIVGINVLYINGQPKVSIVTADNPTPEFPAIQPTFVGGALSGFQEHRVIWRELIEDLQ
ncbi:MAG: PilC/PilY family type IV pilus protein [Methylophilaceae bacterium]